MSTSPSVQILKSNHEELVFILKDSHIGLANAIRRTILGEVPMMAVDVVQIEQNDSPLGDEVLAHRLAFIPFHSDRADELKFHSECCCKKKPELFATSPQYPERCCTESCDKCSVNFELKVQATDNKIIVTSNDITQQKWRKKTKKGEVRPIYYDNKEDAITITKLAPGQACNLKMIVRKGNGDMHAKWNPVSVAYYKPFPHITIADQGSELHQSIADCCPSRVFQMKKDGRIGSINAQACTFCQQCTKLAPSIVQVKPSSTCFIFTIEAIEDTLSPQEIFRKAIKIFLSHLHAILPLA